MEARFSSPPYWLDIWPQTSLWFIHGRNHFFFFFSFFFASNNQSSALFEERSIFAPADLSSEAKTRKRWCHDGYHLQCLGQLQMHRAHPLLRYDLSLGVQREHLPRDLVSRMHVWSAAGNYAGEGSLVWVREKHLLQKAVSCTAEVGQGKRQFVPYNMMIWIQWKHQQNSV